MVTGYDRWHELDSEIIQTHSSAFNLLYIPDRDFETYANVSPPLSADIAKIKTGNLGVFPLEISAIAALNDRKME